MHRHSQQHTTCTSATTHAAPTPRDLPTFIRCSKCGLLLMASQLSLVPLAPSPSCTTDVRPRPLVTTPPSNTCLFCCCLAPALVASKASRDLCWDVWKVNMKRPSTHTQSMRLSPCRERQQRRCCRSLNGKCMMDAVVCRGVGKALPSTSCDGGDLLGGEGREGIGGKCRDVKCIMYTLSRTITCSFFNNVLQLKQPSLVYYITYYCLHTLCSPNACVTDGHNTIIQQSCTRSY